MNIQAASVFCRVFGEAFAKIGYIQVDGTNTVFAKMTSAETVGIISLLPQHEQYPSVYCGISTVYCRNLDPSLWEQQIPLWMNPLTFFYHTHYPDTWARDTMDILSGQSTVNVEKSALLALQTTEQLVLPMLDKVIDLPSAADFLIRYGRAVTECNRISETNAALAEDLLCVRAGYQGDYLETLQTRREFTQHSRSDAERGMESDKKEYTDYARQMKERAEQLKQALRFTTDVPARLKQALSECEQRKIRNLSYLRKAGILPADVQGGTNP